MKIKLITLVTCIFTFTLVKSQTPIGPPTLAAGVGGLVYDRGKLDTELILEILAEKRNEIKSDLSQKLVLGSLEATSFTVYDYVKKNLGLLFNETNSTVIKKEVLQNSAEFAMVVGIAEIYLQNIMQKSRDSKLDSKSLAFFKEYVKWLDAGTIAENLDILIGPEKALSLYLKLKVDTSTDQYTATLRNVNIFQLVNDKGNHYKFLADAIISDSGRYFPYIKDNKIIEGKILNKVHSIEYMHSSMKTPYLNQSNLYMPKVVLLHTLRNKAKYYNETKTILNLKNENKSPNIVLLDLVYDICRKNTYAYQSGFFTRPLSVSEGEYVRLNKYLSMIDVNKEIYESFSQSENELESTVNIFFKYYFTISSIIHNEGYIDSDNVIDNIVCSNSDSIRDKISHLIEKVRVTPISSYYEMKDTDKEALNILISICKQPINKFNIRLNEAALYTIDQKIIPSLVSMNIETNGSFLELLEITKQLYCIIKSEELQNLSNDLGNISIAKIEPFQQLFNLLNHLDKAETYDALITLVYDIGDALNLDQLQSMVNTIVNECNKYVTVDKQQNQITLNGESLAVSLFDKFARNNTARFGSYLSVGVNYGITEFPSTFSDLSEVKAFYFASEKIGLRYNIIDVNRIRSYGTRGGWKSIKMKEETRNLYRSSLISNIHAMVFGSGLLYQIEALNSAYENFTDPFIGLGGGLTFYNGLDINFTYCLPFNNEGFSKSRNFFEFGLDIKFMEYLTRLRNQKLSKS